MYLNISSSTSKFSKSLLKLLKTYLSTIWNAYNDKIYVFIKIEFDNF